MSTFKRLTKAYKSSESIPFNNSSKIVLISDCHRGDGSWADDFSHNQSIYYSALKHYYLQGFTYIELGDGDELWKNKNFSDISNIHTDIFILLHSYFKENRFYTLYGNHDIVKRNPKFVKKNLSQFYNNNLGKFEALFEGLIVHEGLILKHSETNNKLFLVHGHQGDIINDTFWWLGRFLVRNVWRRLELFGFKDPTSAAKNYSKKVKIERKISEWAIANNLVVFTGHTHRPMCPAKEGQFYFNDGSCVHPICITAIEIKDSEISLVKWYVKTKDDGILFVAREVIANPRNISSLYKHK